MPRYVQLECTNPLCPGAELEPDAEIVLTTDEWRKLIAGLDANVKPGDDAFREAWATAERAARDQNPVQTPVRWESRYDPGSRIDPPSVEKPECPSCDESGEVI